MSSLGCQGHHSSTPYRGSFRVILRRYRPTLYILLFQVLVPFFQADGAQTLLDSIPQPRFWVEGRAGPWGPGNPFYELRPPYVKRLIGYINTQPATPFQLRILFGNHIESLNETLAALVTAQMIRVVDSLDGEAVYAPTFALLSRADQEMLSPLMMEAAEAFAQEIGRQGKVLDELLDSLVKVRKRILVSGQNQTNIKLFQGV